jgi:hypothetical protein
MDAEGLEEHWLIGQSNKRQASYVPPLGRAPIGKFGIGKLATYALADKFHIVSKCRGKFWIATMDYAKMMSRGQVLGAAPTAKRQGRTPSSSVANDTTEREYRFWVRQMSAKEAQKALGAEVSGDGVGYGAIQLFGSSAAKSWTIAVLKELRPKMAELLKQGTTRWVLSTAMPLQSGFTLYLDGIPIESSKQRVKVVDTWRLGETFTPPIDDVVTYSDPKAAANDESRVGLVHPLLGRVYGTFDLFEDVLSSGKSGRFGRSHGFFVYVRGRLLNEEDAYFGIDERSPDFGWMFTSTRSTTISRRRARRTPSRRRSRPLATL